MKRLSLILLMLPLIGNAQPDKTGKVQEHLTMKSKIMNKDVAFTLYLPPDYESSHRSYPVVYLLHGYSDDDSGWLQFGEVNRYADNAISTGEIPPMIIAMPDGGVTWYANNFDGSVKYEDFFIKEFIPFIDAAYRTKATKQFRGISGLSMGGYGALLNASKHPELFSACAALSSGIFTDDWIETEPDDMLKAIAGLYFKPGTVGKAKLTNAWYQNSILTIFQTKSVDDLNKVRWYADCGDDDFLYKGNSMFHILLRDRKILHEFRIRDGGHTWDYWRSGITDGLKFIGKSFKQ